MSAIERHRSGPHEYTHTSDLLATAAVPNMSDEILSEEPPELEPSSAQRRRRRRQRWSDSTLANRSPAISGYLTKRGKVNSRSWKTRWFEAFPGDDGVIVYYKNKNKKKQLGRIYLQNAVVEAVGQKIDGGADKSLHGFTISTRKRLWQIVTKNADIVDQWLQVLQQTCTSGPNSKIAEAEGMMSPSFSSPFKPWGYSLSELNNDFETILGSFSEPAQLNTISGQRDQDIRTSGVYCMDFNVDEGDSSTEDDSDQCDEDFGFSDDGDTAQSDVH